MMLKQRKDIFWDLEISPFTYIFNDMTFYFSAESYLNKFSQLVESEITRFTIRTNNIYKDKFNLEVQCLALIRLYTLIEKRGFYIKIREETCTCLDNLTFQIEPKITS